MLGGVVDDHRGGGARCDIGKGPPLTERESRACVSPAGAFLAADGVGVARVVRIGWYL